jgi:roadblock/LC7 domain-containing protein
MSCSSRCSWVFVVLWLVASDKYAVIIVFAIGIVEVRLVN